MSLVLFSARCLSDSVDSKLRRVAEVLDAGDGAIRGGGVVLEHFDTSASWPVQNLLVS